MIFPPLEGIIHEVIKQNMHARSSKISTSIPEPERLAFAVNSPTESNGGAYINFEFQLREKVVIKEIGRIGVVDSLMLDGLGKQYRVTYWDNSERKSSWLYEDEIERK